MNTENINELKRRAVEIKEETVQGANTADRVGGLMYDMIEEVDQLSLNDLTDVQIANPANNQVIGYDSTTGKWKNITSPGGSGGGGGGNIVDTAVGMQETFFINIAHNIVPNLPSEIEYDSSTQTFRHGSQIWQRTNQNPPAGYDTYMMWAWFSSNGVPQSVSGPVRVYNSASDSSNGEDANEIEWIYKRTQEKLVAGTLDTETAKLVGAVGTVNYGGTTINYTNPDMIPPGWTDNPVGIDSEYKYEYAAYRSSILVNGRRTWGSVGHGFSAPILWSAYGEKGIDGDGIEYIFYADSIGTPPSRGDWPPNWGENTVGKYSGTLGRSLTFQDNEFIASGSSWTDDPADLNEYPFGPGSKQWVSIRKKRVWNPEVNPEPTWGQYSEPKLWSGVGTDGVVDGYTVSIYNATMLVTTDSNGAIDRFDDVCGYEIFHNSTRIYFTSASSSDTEYTLTVQLNDIRRSDNGIVNTSDSSDANYIYAEASQDSGGNGIVTVSLRNVTNMDGTNISIPVTIGLPDGTTRNSIIVVTGIASSEGGYAIDLYTSAHVIKTDYYRQNAVPANLNIGVRIGKGETPNVYLSSATPGDPNSAESKGYTFKYYYDEIQDPSYATSIAGSIQVATKRGNTDISSITVMMYKDGVYLESVTLPYVEDGAPAIGISPIKYEIVGISSSVTKYNTGKVSGSIVFTVTKTYQSEVKYLFPSNSTYYWESDPSNPTISEPATEILEVMMNGAANTVSYNIQNRYWTSSLNNVNYNNVPCSQIILYSDTHMPQTSLVIPFIIEGQNGVTTTTVQSINGVAMRFRNWNTLTTDGYGDIAIGTRSSDGVIYKDIIYYYGEYFYVAPSYTGQLDPTVFKNSNNPPVSNGVWNNGLIHIPMLGDAAFQTLLAKYAYIENLTAQELIITDNNKPVAGISSGSVIDSDNTNHSQIKNYTVSTTNKGNVRLWAGFDDQAANLTKSKFYVTDQGFLHAEDAYISGEISSIDNTVNLFSSGAGWAAQKGLTIKPTSSSTKNTAILRNVDYGSDVQGGLLLKWLHDSQQEIEIASTKVLPGDVTVAYKGSGTPPLQSKVEVYANNNGGQITLSSASATGTVDINGANSTIACKNIVGPFGSSPIAMPANIRISNGDTITLPSEPIEGQFYFCKDATNNLTIQTGNSNTSLIDPGSQNALLRPYNFGGASVIVVYTEKLSGHTQNGCWIVFRCN